MLRAAASARLSLSLLALRAGALALLVQLLASAPLGTLAWGSVGHAIVATIAQTQLHPAVRAHLCTILPSFTAYQSAYPREGAPHTHCHLANLASWPDTQHVRYPWSGRLHYINPVADDPPTHCTYGEKGWTSPADNLVTALYNYTSRLAHPAQYVAAADDDDGSAAKWERDMALRMVVHLMGDAAQPLHLTGRARGGNDIWVRFEGRKTKLHTAFDSLFLQAQIRALANYTAPLPSARIESALQDKIYDSYTRWVLKEGLGQPSAAGSAWWPEAEQQEWLTCPAAEEDADADAAGQQLALGSSSQPGAQLGVGEGEDVICAMAWTRLMHPLVCKYAFADPVPRSDDPALSLLDGAAQHEDEADVWTDDDAGLTLEQLDSYAEIARRGRRRRGGRRRGRQPWRRPSYPQPNPNPPHGPPGRGGGGGGGEADLPELDVPRYFGRINDDKILQLQLAKAGIRLGALLNSLLLDEALKARPGSAL